MEPADQSTPSTPSPPVEPAPKVYRARPWRTLLAAVLTELVVIAAACNQGVVTALTKHLNDGSRSYADYSRGGIDAVTTFGWRFSAADGQATHVWAAQFAAIGTLLLLTIIGVIAVARGSVTFGRVFVAVWAVVAASAPIAIMVRELIVVPNAPGPLQSRVGQSVYGYSAFGPVIVAGLAIGLIVGLFSAFVAVLGRRTIRTAVLPDEDAPRDEDGEYLDTTFGPTNRQPTTAYEPPPWGTEQTTPYQPTQAWGAEQEPAYPPARPWEQDQPSQQTDQFPQQSEQFPQQSEQFSQRTEQLPQPEQVPEPEQVPQREQPVEPLPPPPREQDEQSRTPVEPDESDQTQEFRRPEQSDWSAQTQQFPAQPEQTPTPQTPEPPAAPPAEPSQDVATPQWPPAPQQRPPAAPDETAQIPPVTDDDPGRRTS